MAIKSINSKPDRKPEIDLTGPQGNVFFLMGRAEEWAEELGKDGPAILADMESSNYEHAVEVFEREFGDYCTLYR